jgi:hypothetical protein
MKPLFRPAVRPIHRQNRKKISWIDLLSIRVATVSGPPGSLAHLCPVMMLKNRLACLRLPAMFLLGALVIRGSVATSQTVPSGWLVSDSLMGQLQRMSFEQNPDRDLWTIRINEVCASNGDIIPDGQGVFSDWIELRNFGDEPINLQGWWLSDNPAQPFKHQISESLWIEPGGYLLLWANNQPAQGPAHLNFSLDMQGEHVILHSETQEQVDAMGFGFSPENMSWSYVDMSGTWALTQQPTPLAENSTDGYAGVPEAPWFSIQNLFVEFPAQLTISHPIAQMVRYTLDGTVPDENSPILAGPIVLTENLCVRARAYAPGYLPGRVGTRCYLTQQSTELDVVTVALNHNDFWGPSGIYTNAFSGLEKAVSVGHYSPDGQQKYSLDMGVKIHAPDGRPQKSLRFYARSIYGQSSLDHQLFPDKNIDSFKRFVLRNAGNDGRDSPLSRTGLRDPLITWLYRSIDSDYGRAAYRPVHLYLNSNYWGIYNMRERQDEHWIKSNYGYEPGTYDFLERTADVPSTFSAISGNWDDYNLMYNAAIDLDLSQPENYAIIKDWMNIRNFCDYQLTQILICNQDHLSNNMKFWKPYDNSRKWEWIIWDTDWGFGTYYPSYPHGYPTWNALNFSLSNWGGWTSNVETLLFQNLVESPEFLETLCTRAADLHNSYFLPNRIIGKLHEYRDEIIGDIAMQFDRWGNSMLNWTNRLDYMESFITERPGYYLQHFTDRFDLGEIRTIYIEVNPPGAGYVEVNTIQTDSDTWQGNYFEAIPVRVKAVAHPGYAFQFWDNGPMVAEQWISLVSDSTVVAHFHPMDYTGFPIINEIHYRPAAWLDSEEWIEIRNNGPESIDLSGWTLNDGGNSPFTFEEGTILAADSFLVVCKDSLIFNQIYPNMTKRVGNFTFNLSNQGETLFLKDPSGLVVNAVTYGISAPWPSAPNGNGPTLELANPFADNNNGSHWFARPQPGGTPGAENFYVSDINDLSEFSISLFPNPSDGRNTFLKLVAGSVGRHHITLTDNLGRIAAEAVVDKPAEGEWLLSMSDLFPLTGLDAGVYLISVRQADEIIGRKRLLLMR